MIKLALFVFVSTTISTGYLQDIKNSLFPPSVSNDNTRPQIWTYQDYPIQRRIKPCPKKRNKNGAEEQWIPSYSSRITKPRYDTPILQPQALKNDEVTEYKIDAELGNNDQNLSGRRAFDLASNKVEDISSTSSLDEDCVDYLESANESPVSSNAEETAIKIIKDCLKRKEENSNNLPVLGSSRRSMSDGSDADLLDKDHNNNYPRQFEDSAVLDDTNGNDIARDASTQNNIEEKSDTQLTSKLMDPVIGTGINVGQSNNIFLRDRRVCYACSTATNPSCWQPDQRTTVKYCPKEHSCVTKSFGVKNSLTVIRDCATSCEDSSLVGIEPKFTSCKLCHSDYCNGAGAVNTYNLIIILVISIAKCTILS